MSLAWPLILGGVAAVLFVVNLTLIARLELRLRPIRRASPEANIPPLVVMFDGRRAMRFLFWSEDYKRISDPLVASLVPAIRVATAVLAPVWLAFIWTLVRAGF